MNTTAPTDDSPSFANGFADGIKAAAEVCQKGAAWDMIIHDQWATNPGGREKRADLRASSQGKDAVANDILALSTPEATDIAALIAERDALHMALSELADAAYREDIGLDVVCNAFAALSAKETTHD